MSGAILHVAKASGISGSEAHLLLLLPGLRELGWDVRLLLLHENEPGALELAGRLRAAEVPVAEVTLARSFDPMAFRRIVSHVRAERPTLLHTHLVHADFYGLAAGRLAGVPVLASTKHGFNAFREQEGIRSRRSHGRARARPAHRNLARARRVPRCPGRVSTLADFEIVHYGIEPGSEPPPATPGARLAAVGRLIPIKGLETLIAAVADLPEVERRDRGGRAAAGGARGRHSTRAGSARSGAAARPRRAGRPGDGASGHRRRAVTRRRVRHGRARGDGARPRGDRERGRGVSPRSSSRVRPGCSFRQAIPPRWERRSGSSSPTRTGSPRWVRPVAGGRSRCSARTGARAGRPSSTRARSPRV